MSKISACLLCFVSFTVWGCGYIRDSSSPSSLPAWPLRVQGIKQSAEKRKLMSSKLAQDLYLQGINLYQRGLYKPAIERITSAVEEDSGFLAPYMTLGEIYYLTQQTHLAEESYSTVLKLDPSLVEAWVGLGILYWEREKYELAHQYLITALELQPQQPKAQKYLKLTQQKLAQRYLAQGIALNDLGQLEQARLRFQLAIQTDPQLGEAYLELGQLYLHQQQYQPAVDNFQQALGIMPEVAIVWKDLGQAYLGLYEYDLARKALQRSLILKPDDQEGQRLLKVTQQELYRDRPVPPEFMEISSTPAITMGELAALLALNLRIPQWKSLTSLDTPVVIPDISSHWAKEYIIYVVRNRLMSQYPNHYFLPDTLLTRGKVADIIDKILQEVAGLVPLNEEYEKRIYEDVSPENQYYGAITRVAALELIPPQEKGVFGVTDQLTGLEALEMVDRLVSFLEQ